MQSGESQSESVPHLSDGAVQRLPVWPMIPGVMCSALVLNFVCSWLRLGSAPHIGLLLLATSLMFIAVMVSGSVVRAIYTKMYPGMRRVSTPVIRAACITALWIPAWILFVETWSLLMLVAGAICMACLGVFLKQCDIESAAEQATVDARQPGTPFLFEGKSLMRVLLPS
ncbi:MAG TPA: hypothetical protein VK638_01755, partial [Edaphobacter sp.]|nr:hypothetical protein [Edaphobacter sp.]